MEKLKFTLLLLLTLGFYIAGAQDFKVKGVVFDQSNNTTMPSVNVVEKGTTNGTITDVDGNFTITVADANATLVFSFIGFEVQELPLEGKSSVNVQLIEDIAGIDEVVVIGYGTQKKSDLTGSVAVVDVAELEKSSSSNMGTMLQGRVAGVNVTTDGQPGADPTIRIRGISTFGDAAPLYVIDGVPVGGNPRDLSPNDIETMQVLKDASAAAIYGSRAANGVIIITTKHGKKNSPLKVAYKGYLGIDDVYQRVPLLTRENYQTMYNTSLTNQGMALRPGNDPDSPYYINNIDTDWQDAGFKTGVRQNHNVSMTGGGENGTYAVILDYLDSQGTLQGVGPDYKRYSVRTNNTLEKGIFKAGASVFYSHTNQNTLNVTNNGGFAGGNPPMVVKLLGLIPTMAVKDANSSTGWGTYDSNITGEDYSLNIIGVNNLLDDKTVIDRVLTSGFAELDFSKPLNMENQSLKYKVNVSYDQTHVHDFRWIPDFVFSNFYINTDASLDEAWREYKSSLIENTLSYNAQFGKAKVDAIVGQMFQAYGHSRIDGHGERYLKPYYRELRNAEITSSNSWEEESYLSSYLGRLNVDYDNKYLMTVTARRDGTSKVNKEQRFGVFPSFSAGWKIHNESFFPVDDYIVSEFKLRGGWGQLGNSAIGPYDYLATLNRNVVYNFNNEKVIGTTEPSVVSQLVWETKTMTNIGLDMSFLDRKIDFTVEYYNSLSEDLLLEVDIPLTVGSINDRPRANAASLRNKGFEFIGTYHERSGEFKYDVSVNLATLNNEVIELNASGQPRYGVAARSIEGEEIGRHYGYIYDGIFQTTEEVSDSPYQTASTTIGDIKYKDLNEDGQITEDDKTDLGSGLPDFTYGFNVSCDYKGLDFSVFAQGAAGYLIADNMYRNLMHAGGGLNWHEDILNAWTPENTNTDIPRVVYQDPNSNGRDSDRPGWLQSGNHLRISNVTLGYTLPNTLVNRVSISSVRVYASIQNLHTFTKYQGYNPDFSNPDPFSPGYNDGSYPVPRSFMFGVNFDF